MTEKDTEEKRVWFLTKVGNGKGASPCVVRALMVKDVGTKTWVRYQLDPGSAFVWEGIAQNEMWRIQGAKADRTLTKDDFRNEAFAVKRQSPPAAVMQRVALSSPHLRPSLRLTPSSSSSSAAVPSSSSASSPPPSTPISAGPRTPPSSESPVRDHEDWFPEEMTWSWITTSRIFTVKRIPRAARLLWADVLTKTLQDVANNKDDDRRRKILFALPTLCLRLLRRGGKKKQKAFEVAPSIIENLQKPR